MVHTDKGIAVKLPSDDISEDLVKNITKIKNIRTTGYSVWILK